VLDVQILEYADLPSGSDQSKAEIILLCLHEKGAVKTADFSYGIGSKPDATSDKHARQGAALKTPVGQMNSKPGGAQTSVCVEPLDHARYGATAGVRVVIQEDDKSAAGTLDAEGFCATPRVAAQSYKLIYARAHCFRCSVAGCVVNYNHFVVTAIEPAPVDLIKRVANDVTPVVRGQYETYLGALNARHRVISYRLHYKYRPVRAPSASAGFANPFPGRRDSGL
jgi:hypothetical protein